MISKEKKKEILEELKKIFKDSVSVVFANFHGLSVSDATQMRKKLREEDIGYKVAKKTLIHCALEGEKIEGEVPELEGEIALAFGEDLVKPASGIWEFQKKLENKIEILGGVFDRAYKNKEEMTEIAQIPPVPTLRGMFVNVINSPIQGLAVVLDKIAEQREA